MKYIKSTIFSTFTFLLIFYGCAKTQEEKELKTSKNNKISIKLESVVRPSNTQNIISSVNGYVNKIFVKNGDKVKKGDIIFSMGDQLIKMDIEKAEKELLLLKKFRRDAISNSEINRNIPSLNLSAIELKKVAYLKSKGYINQFEEDTYIKNYINTIYLNKTKKDINVKNIQTLDQSIMNKEFTLKKLKHKLKYINSYAQIDGFVSGLNITKGQPIMSGLVVGKIVNIDKVIVKAGFSAGLLPFIHKDQSVTIDFITAPPMHIKTKITKVNPIVDKKFERMTLDILIDNKSYILQDGTTALVTIKLSPKGQEKVKKYFLQKKSDTILEIKSKI